MKDIPARIRSYRGQDRTGAQQLRSDEQSANGGSKRSRQQSRSQSPRSLWSAETTRLDLWDNPKPEAKFWLPVSRAHVRACLKVYKVSMRKGYIPGRKGAKITSLPLAPYPLVHEFRWQMPITQAYEISWELVSSRFARCPILFKPLGAKESNYVELLVQFLIVTESCSSGKICFRRYQAQATQIGVKTLGLMRTYGFFQLQYDLCATSFLLNLKISMLSRSTAEKLYL